MATTTDIDRTRLVDNLLDSLAALQRNTLPQTDLKAIAADLLDHAADLDRDEAIEPWDAGDYGDDEGDRAFDVARDRDAEEEARP